MNRRIILLSLFFSIISLSFLNAQLADCITFDEPEANTLFNTNTGVEPGQIVHYFGNTASMSMDVFTNDEGNTQFGELLIYNNVGSGVNPPVLRLNSATATFNYPNPVSHICFTLLIPDFEPFINFGINGETHYFNNIASSDLQETFADFSIDVDLINNSSTTSVCIQGAINSFTFGGAGVSIDNICSEVSVPSCFNNPFYIHADCLNQDSVTLFIDFDPQGTTNESFDLFIDDEFQGFYAFANLPLEIENAILSGLSDNAVIRIQENDNPDCSYTEIIPLPTCYTEGCIGFEIFSDEMESAFAAEWPLDFLYYEEQGITFTTATIFANGAALEPDAMLRFAPNGIPGFNSSNGVSMGHFRMASIINFTAREDLVNTVSLDFYHTAGTSATFSVGVNEQEILEFTAPFQGGFSQYPLDDGTIIVISHDFNDPNQGTIQFVGQAISEIFIGGHEIIIDNLCFTERACFISDLNVNQFACDEDTGVYEFVLNFSHQLTLPQDSFVLSIDNEPYGIFSYYSLPITFELEAGPGTEVRFLVQDQFDTDCAEDLNIEVHNCEFACADFEASVQGFQCYNEEFGGLTIELNTLPTYDLFYLVGVDNPLTYNTYYNNYNTITFSVTAEASNQNFRLINNLTGCETIIEPFTELVEACAGCDIYDISLTPTDCDENGQYYIDVSFASTYGEDLFNIIVNEDQVFGPFQQGSELFPIQVGPIDGANTAMTTIDIVQVDGYCSATRTVEYVCENDCTLTVHVQAGECHDDGTADLIVIISSPLDPGFDFYVIEIDNNVYGVYEIGEEPLILPSALPSTTIGHVVTIRQDDTDCSQTFGIINDCIDCGIYNVSVSGTECDANNQYYITVYFEANLVDGAFIVYDSYSQEEYVSFSGIPLDIGPFDYDEIQVHEIIILQENAICEELLSYTQECNPTNECNFNDVYAEGHQCDGDQFLVDVEFNNTSGGDLGFYIFGDGMIFGPYDYGLAFYTFGPLNGSNQDHTIMLLDIANPACFTNYNLSYLCSDECVITSVIAEPTECNDDGQFFVELDVEAANHGEEFSVLGNGNNYGTFNYNDLPITLGPFDGDGETPLEFGVIDLENGDCTNWTEFTSPNCQPCDIRDFEYEISCGEESYDLSINFIYENPENHRFIVFIGDEVYEGYEYDELPIVIHNIPFSFNGETIRVEDFENELCGETLDFNIPCCDLGNLLNELEVTECGANGEYYLRVHGFNGANLSDSLVVNYAPAGSSIIAEVTVAYADLAEEIGPLVGDGSTGYLFVFSDQENDCSVTRTLEPVFCDDSSCIEFEGVQGVFGPDFEHDSGDLVVEENEVRITYQRNPVSNCSCNLYVLEDLPNIDFGNDHIIVTQNSGFGIDLTEVPGFNTVNIDFYHPEGDVSISVNGENPITASNFSDFPSSIADGVELQVTFNNSDQSQGTLTFSGDNIDYIQLFSNETAAFDNICLSLDDNIWPGDTNTDNLANHFDLLNIGIAYGSTGSSRAEINEVWAGLIGSNWNENFANGTNFKHADANGDGIVNEVDQIVLEQNYGLEHGTVVDFEPLPFTDLDPIISLEAPEGGELPNGAVFEIPIYAGTADLPINDIYGLAFTLEIDPNVIDLSSLEIIYPTSWFGEPGVNTIHIDHIDEDGNLQVAISRKDLNPVSGFGPIMYLRGIIDDIVAIPLSSDISIKNVYAINVESTPFPLRPQGIEFAITNPDNTFDRQMLRSSFSIFPNPTSGMIHYNNYYNMAADRISVINSTGQQVLSVKHPDMKINLSQLPAGIYFLKVHLQGFIFTEKIVKLD